MLINDNVYGHVIVNEPVLVELIKCTSLNRLKNISQYGVPDKYYHYKNYSRYDHSIGVMILLRKLNASLEEQVAGLLHDVSVFAFSHIADWVFGQGSKGIDDYHDSIHFQFISKTEIPSILKKYGFDAETISNHENFPLLERKIPSLCADRLDYSLRDFKNYQNPRIIGNCVRHLKVYNNEIVFDNVDAALDYSRNFLQLTMKHWNGYEGILRYHIFSETLKYAIEKGIVSEPDFSVSEGLIIEKLENSDDNEIKKALNLLVNKNLSDFPKTLNKKVMKKFRYVDPYVVINKISRRLSEIVPEYGREVEHYRDLNSQGLIV